ncbi:MAG TPA: DUF4432 family protein [Chloroflexota bacterium]|nr:DUF4432 family protein [Chloroflexota bacterium]
MAAPQVTTDRLPSGWEAVRLRNDALGVTLLPGKGGEIYSFSALRQGGVDLLWKSPWGLRPPPVPSASGPESQAVWLDHYGGGWQELLPNAGGPCSVNGAAHSFHGEASVVPWDYAIERPDGAPPRVRLAVRLARTPFQIEKLVSLDADRPVLRLWERVTNQGTSPQPFMWGHHPAFGAPFLAGGCRLDVPAGAFLSNAPQVSPNTWIAAGERSAWPHVKRANGGTVDLSVVPGPESRTDNFGYLLDVEAGWYALSNDALGLGFALAWPLDVFPCVWLWQELCGTQGYPWYGTTYVMGVEPHSSPTAAGLAAAIERGTARTLQPGESIEATLTASLFVPRGTVTHVTPDGDPTFT